MASTNGLIISTLLLLSLFSFHVHAREFFSKIPSISNNNNNNNEKEETVRTVTVPGTQEPDTFNPEAQKQEPEPTFYAQTENSYGLYGHESGQLSPVSTAAKTTTYEPYVTPVQSQENYNNYPNNNNRNSNYYNNKDTTGYENNAQQSFGETSFAENENVGRSEFGNAERQGMSDTRFMENGKYYYDINNEQRNNNENGYPNRFRPNSRGSVSSTSELYENNGGGYYGNTENSYSARDFQNDMEFDQRQEEQFEP